MNSPSITGKAEQVIDFLLRLAHHVEPIEHVSGRIKMRVPFAQLPSVIALFGGVDVENGARSIQASRDTRSILGVGLQLLVTTRPCFPSVCGTISAPFDKIHPRRTHSVNGCFPFLRLSRFKIPNSGPCAESEEGPRARTVGS